MFTVFAVYVHIDENNRLSPKKVFTTFSLLTYVRLIFLTYLVKAIVLIAEARVALKRIVVRRYSNLCVVNIELGIV